MELHAIYQYSFSNPVTAFILPRRNENNHNRLLKIRGMSNNRILEPIPIAKDIIFSHTLSTSFDAIFVGINRKIRQDAQKNSPGHFFRAFGFHLVIDYYCPK